MNERIKQLAIKARLLTGWPVGEVEYQKFTELIVKECVGIVAKRKDQAIDDGCNVDEAMSMAEMDLLEQFGVEE